MSIPLPTMSSSIDDRPRSVRSVASNSSMSSTSAVSLTRRSRTRTRSKTVTGSTSPACLVAESQILDSLLLPPRSADLATSSRSLTSQEADSATGEVTLVAPLPHPSPMPPKQSKAAKQASQLASIETSYNTAFSAFSRDPELTPNARHSFSTQKSSTSSSFYPPSTSTISGPESPASPRAAAEEDSQQPNISLLLEDSVEEMQDYDGDDVAYRLRLLVNNNYFLPPAHMKPSPRDFAASMNAKKSQKHSAPAFLDIFRVGRAKPKPTTPVAPTFGNGPMLRTTSDSIAAPFALGKQTRSPQAPHHAPPPMNGNVDRGRVVVVRERMTNIAVAAKQAEQEMKTRNARRDHGSDKARQQPAPANPLQLQDADIIDPTDAVDLPLPASNYPFAVQASALHGLGVQDSVGAAVLADRLPPHSPGSPGMSVSYEADDWRKALLREAVHHSLDNTPDESMFSYVPGTSTPMLASPRVNGELSRSSTPGTRAKRLQQRIAEPQISLDISEPLPVAAQTNQKDTIHKTEQSQASTSKSTFKLLTAPGSNDSRRSSYLPARAITPIANLTPLTPAPRRHIFNHPGFSASHADLQKASSAEVLSSISPKSRLRRSMSTPMLSESYDSMRQFIMTPPPHNLPATRRSSQMTQLTLQSQSYETGREMPSRASEFSSQSHFDDCDGRIVRGSPRLSALGNRPSFSRYSQASLSPTTSAFQDALNHPGSQSSASSLYRSSFDEPTEPESRTRSSIASPPPRPSTSISHNALRPPPRSSSFNYPLSALGRNIVGSEPRIEITNTSPVQGPQAHARPTMTPFASSSSVSTAHRRDATLEMPLTLEIPASSAEVAIHSPAPSSPTSFFDTLQEQPNAMDDLDSSSDEESDRDGGEGEEEEETQVVRNPRAMPLPSPSQTHTSPPPFILDSRARANSTVSVSPVKPSAMMRLGNFSAPYVGRGQTERVRTVPLPLPIGVADSKRALGFIPTRAPFFTERKNEMGNNAVELGTTLFVQAQTQQAQAQMQNLGSVAECPGSSSIPSGMVGAKDFTSTGPSNTEKRWSATTSQASSQSQPTTTFRLGGPVSPTLGSFPLQQHGASDRRPDAVKKLDGMLVEHMEAEKDRIRKIAGALKSSSQVHLPGSAVAGRPSQEQI